MACGCNNKKKVAANAANWIVTLPSGRQKAYVHEGAARAERDRTGGTMAAATPVSV